MEQQISFSENLQLSIVSSFLVRILIYFYEKVVCHLNLDQSIKFNTGIWNILVKFYVSLLTKNLYKVFIKLKKNDDCWYLT